MPSMVVIANETHLNPSMVQATWASLSSKPSEHTVPQTPKTFTSRRPPVSVLLSPASLTSTEHTNVNKSQHIETSAILQSCTKVLRAGQIKLVLRVNCGKEFLSLVSILIRYVPVLYESGWMYCHSFFLPYGSTIILVLAPNIFAKVRRRHLLGGALNTGRVQKIREFGPITRYISQMIQYIAIVIIECK